MVECLGGIGNGMVGVGAGDWGTQAVLSCGHQKGWGRVPLQITKQRGGDHLGVEVDYGRRYDTKVARGGYCGKEFGKDLETHGGGCTWGARMNWGDEGGCEE